MSKMLRRIQKTTLLTLALLLPLVVLQSGTAEAQAFGRVTVVVKNQQGEPLEGVDVTVTSPDLQRFLEKKKTNKKGKATVSFTDATKIYNFKFEFADYQPAELPIKPEIRGSITREVVLTEGQVVQTGAESRVIYSPSEKVFNEGVMALKAGDTATATTKFQEAIEKKEDMAAAHAALAGAFLQQENFSGALASAKRYLELVPDNPNGLFMLYDAHIGLGNQAEADAALEQLKKADKGGDTVALIYNAGVAAVKDGNYATAKTRFLEALDLDPNLPQALGALAVIFISEENYEEAAKYSEKHLALVPDSARSLRIRWDAYRMLGTDAEKTKVAFDALAKADPKVLANEFYNKGNELFDAGDTAGAKEQFQRVLEIEPEHPRAHYRLGVCFASSQDNAEAKKHLEKFIELAPDDPEAQVAKDMLGYLN